MQVDTKPMPVTREQARDSLNAAADTTLSVACSLGDLSEAIARCGNYELAFELAGYAKQLREAARLTQAGYGAYANIGLADAMQSSANILAATLAGIHVAERK